MEARIVVTCGCGFKQEVTDVSERSKVASLIQAATQHTITLGHSVEIHGKIAADRKPFAEVPSRREERRW